jgi:hypothetical protein
VDVGIPRSADPERALAVLRDVAEGWASETRAALDPPVVQGIMRFSGGGDPILRLMVRVDAGRRVDTEIELRRRIRSAFDREQWLVAGAS